MRAPLVLLAALTAGCGTYRSLVATAEYDLHDAKQELAYQKSRVAELEAAEREEPEPEEAEPEPEVEVRPVAVALDIEDKSERLTPEDRAKLSAYFALAVVEAGRWVIVPRGSVLRALQDEKARSYRACVDDACHLELGKALAARIVLHPKLIADGDRCAFGVTLYELRAETTIWARTIKSACTKSTLFEAAKAIAGSIPKPGEEEP